MKTFWFKIARWALKKIDEKDLIKTTDVDNKICKQLIEIINKHLEK